MTWFWCALGVFAAACIAGESYRLGSERAWWLYRQELDRRDALRKARTQELRQRLTMWRLEADTDEQAAEILAAWTQNPQRGGAS